MLGEDVFPEPNTSRSDDMLPFFGTRSITTNLKRAGVVINRKRIQRLMRLMGLEGMVPGPHTSRTQSRPFLLRTELSWRARLNAFGS